MQGYKKSQITLENIRPHLSSISGLFGVPFGDCGFLFSEQEIKKAKAEHEKMFITSVALILGITEEEAKKKVVAKKDNSKYWCWKHNVNYEVNIKRPKSPTIFARMHGNGRITLNVEGGYKCDISYFEVDKNGDIYQSESSDINSIEDIAGKINNIKKNEINKELNKLKVQEINAIKRLSTTREKIKKLEDELKSIE